MDVVAIFDINYLLDTAHKLNVQDVFWTSYVRSSYALCLAGNHSWLKRCHPTVYLISAPRINNDDQTMLKNLIFKLTYWFENKKKSHSLITHFSQYFWQNCFWNTLGNSFCVKLQMKIAMFSFFWLVVVGIVIVFVNCDLRIFTDWERVKSFQPSEHVLLGCFIASF